MADLKERVAAILERAGVEAKEIHIRHNYITLEFHEGWKEVITDMFLYRREGTITESVYCIATNLKKSGFSSKYIDAIRQISKLLEKPDPPSPLLTPEEQQAFMKATCEFVHDRDTIEVFEDAFNLLTERIFNDLLNQDIGES